MKLLPIYKKILSENTLKSGAFWIDEKGRFLPVESTHFKYVVDNLGDFETDKSQDYYYDVIDNDNHAIIEELYKLAFNEGWIRLVIGSRGSTANIEYRKNFEPRAMSSLMEKLISSKTLNFIRIDDGSTEGHTGKSYDFDEENDKEDFLKKYGRYLR